MKKIIIRAAVLAASILLLAFGVQAQTAVSGTGVQDLPSGPLASGSWCFSTQCISVVQGAFSGSVTAGTQNVTVKNATGTTILTLDSVGISGSSYSWNSVVVGSGATYSGEGVPYLPCSSGASYSETENSLTWNCVVTGSTSMWKLGSAQGTVLGPGVIAGSGVPTLLAVVPTLYVRTDVYSVYGNEGVAGSTSNSWGLISSSTLTSEASYDIPYYSAATTISGVALTGVLYGNGSSAAPSVATGAQVAAKVSGSPVTELLAAAEYSNGTCTTAKTIDPANGNNQKVTLTAADGCVLTFTQPSSGTSAVQLKVIQAGGGANGTISGGLWAGGTVPTVTATSAAVDIFRFYLDGTSAYGSTVGQNLH